MVITGTVDRISRNRNSFDNRWCSLWRFTGVLGILLDLVDEDPIKSVERGLGISETLITLIDPQERGQQKYIKTDTSELIDD